VAKNQPNETPAAGGKSPAAADSLSTATADQGRIAELTRENEHLRGELDQLSSANARLREQLDKCELELGGVKQQLAAATAATAAAAGSARPSPQAGAASLSGADGKVLPRYVVITEKNPGFAGVRCGIQFRDGQGATDVIEDARSCKALGYTVVDRLSGRPAFEESPTA
jgi:hypothetical protein